MSVHIVTKKSRLLGLFVLLALTAASGASSLSWAQSDRIFVPYSSDPVVRHGSGDWDSKFTNPGAVLYYNGMFHMFRSGFKVFPGPVEWGYVTSPDGYTWTKQGDQPVFTTDQVPFSDSGVMPSSALVLADGTWVIYFYTIGHGDRGPSVIGRATAHSPTGPWTSDPQPVLQPDSPGSWDDREVSRPSVFHTANGWIMYFGGSNATDPEMVGMATSPDGIHWTKYNDPSTTSTSFAESDPVLGPTDPNAWDNAGIEQPHVQQTPDGWVMLYRSGTGPADPNRDLGYAISTDGLHWTRSENNPILSIHDVRGGRGIFDTNLLYQNGTYFVYWEVSQGDNSDTSDIYLATHKGSLPLARIPQPTAAATATPQATAVIVPTPVPTEPIPGDNSATFPETGKTVKGLFLDYWNQNGGLAQQGYPISDVMGEISDLDGKPYTVQYFERAVFEYHPQNPPPYNVLLSQLGTFRYKLKYPSGAPGQQQDQTNGLLFPQTGHWVGGRFLEYWQSHGGLAQQGYPISDEFTEVSDLNGQSYLVQYFERAVFEYHPENQPPNDVLLSQLGTFQFKAKYGGQ